MRIVKNTLQKDLIFPSADGYPVSILGGREVIVTDNQAKAMTRCWKFLVDKGEYIAPKKVIKEVKKASYKEKKIEKKIKGEKKEDKKVEKVKEKKSK